MDVYDDNDINERSLALIFTAIPVDFVVVIRYLFSYVIFFLLEVALH
jgi:sensor domain CHASE-containing protein